MGSVPAPQAPVSLRAAPHVPPLLLQVPWGREVGEVEVLAVEPVPSASAPTLPLRMSPSVALGPQTSPRGSCRLKGPGP